MENTQSQKLASLTVVEYKPILAFFGFLSMVVFHIPLLFHSQTSFYKLFGLGKKGRFELNADLKLYAIFIVFDPKNSINKSYSITQLYGNFIALWLKLFAHSINTYILQPAEGHGIWDGTNPFDTLNTKIDDHEPVAIITRASIRWHKVISFWKSVPYVAQSMAKVEGLKVSYGLGELPLIRQATFTIWDSMLSAKNFAYKMKEHKQVINQTRIQQWYSEEMFVRFRVLEEF